MAVEEKKPIQLPGWEKKKNLQAGFEGMRSTILGGTTVGGREKREGWRKEGIGEIRGVSGT